MNGIPEPLEVQAQETVESYIEHDAVPADVLDRVAVLHHNERYFEALDLVVHARDAATDRTAASATTRRGSAD